MNKHQSESADPSNPLSPVTGIAADTRELHQRLAPIGRASPSVLTITLLKVPRSVLAGGLFNIAVKELAGEPLQLEYPAWLTYVLLLCVAVLITTRVSARAAAALMVVPICLLFITGTGLGDKALFLISVIATPATIVLARKHNW